MTIVATCGICGEPIGVDLTNAEELVMARVEREVREAVEAHLRSHPAAEQARFWLRCFLDEVHPSERAIAVRSIYSQLRALWGDQDGRGVYSIDETLGSASMYRLWQAANRCTYSACPHGTSDHWQAAPDAWHGTDEEWTALEVAAGHHCTCLPGSPGPRCLVHNLLVDDRELDRLLFARRIAARLQAEEFCTMPVVHGPTVVGGREWHGIDA
jgi:hypothetical protein